MKHKPENITKEDWDAVDSPAVSAEMLSRMKPVKKNHPDIPARVRGPQKFPLKVPISMRLNGDVVKYFKSKGKGWQTKINDILQEYMRTHD